MKRTTYIKDLTGSTIRMTDGTAWEVLDHTSALRSLPPLVPSVKVETEDGGPEKTIKVLSSGLVMRARKLRAVA
jgi:hypothetical protein